MIAPSGSEEILWVIKIGGEILDRSNHLETFYQRFARLSGKKILVHGGGKQATHLAHQLGITPTLVDGRRITDASMLRVVTMVYGGLINRRLVAQLAARGFLAIGLTGADGNIILAQKRPPRSIDYGRVGDIQKIEVARLDSLLRQGYLPVVAPLTHDGQGRLLNTNADTIAAGIAAAMVSHYQTFLFFAIDRPGVLQHPSKDSTFLPRLSYSEFRRLQAKGAIQRGMIPKLEQAFQALQQGVTDVWIGHPRALAEEPASGALRATRLVASSTGPSVARNR